MVAHSAAEVPSEVGLQSRFGFDQGNAGRPPGSLEPKSDHVVCKHKQEVASPLKVCMGCDEHGKERGTMGWGRRRGLWRKTVLRRDPCACCVLQALYRLPLASGLGRFCTQKY